MVTQTMTLNELIPGDWGLPACEAFEPCASYSAPMDCIIYLQEDASYRSDRIDQFLTILWHPHEQRVIGIKLKGMRFLFESLQTVVRSVTGKDLADDKFVPLLGAVQLALKMRMGVPLSEHFEKDRSDNLAALARSYELARGVAVGVNFETDQFRVAETGLL